MNKNQIFFVILISAILAFVVAFLFRPKQELPTLKNEQQEEITINEEILPAESDITELKVQNNTKELEIKKEYKSSSSKQIKTIEKNVVPEDMNSQNNTKIEEAGISFEDTGIIEENGTIIITRDFKIKSPTKYSFRDYGVLQKSSY